MATRKKKRIKPHKYHFLTNSPSYLDSKRKKTPPRKMIKLLFKHFLAACKTQHTIFHTKKREKKSKIHKSLWNMRLDNIIISLFNSWEKQEFGGRAKWWCFRFVWGFFFTFRSVNIISFLFDLMPSTWFLFWGRFLMRVFFLRNDPLLLLLKWFVDFNCPCKFFGISIVCFCLFVGKVFVGLRVKK